MSKAELLKASIVSYLFLLQLLSCKFAALNLFSEYLWIITELLVAAAAGFTSLSGMCIFPSVMKWYLGIYRSSFTQAYCTISVVKVPDNF